MSARHAKRGVRFASLASSILLGLLTVLALCSVVLGFAARPGADGVSRIAGHPILTVLSGSMRPAFRPGDMLIDDRVSGARAEHLAVGDVITFRVTGTSNDFITHRIAAVKTSATGATGAVSYQTKGDANNAPDQDLVQPNQVVGVYQSHLPYGGYLLQDVHRRSIFLLFILLPLAYFVGSEVLQRWAKSRPAKSGSSEEQLPADETAASATSSENDPADHRADGRVLASVRDGARGDEGTAS